MRTVIQRVNKASVTIEGNIKSSINEGLLILVGIEETDTLEDAEWLAKKISTLRIFNDDNGVMNKSVIDIDGELLVISQFTLFASYKKGNRPSWFRAARHEISVPLYEKFCIYLQQHSGIEVKTGTFGADMKVELLNDGPVTICMDTKNKERNNTNNNKQRLRTAIEMMKQASVILLIIKAYKPSITLKYTIKA